MRLIISLVAICATIASYAQSERLDYYQHVKTVYSNGRTENLSGSNVQFVKRTRQNGKARCYDATSSGLDHLNGTLFFSGKRGSNEVYQGRSYWGDDATYQFDDNRGYLNVKDKNGNIYVFRCASAPSGRTRSSYINPKGSVDGWDAVAEWNKIHTPVSTYESASGSSSGSNSRATKSSTSRSSGTCSYCHGAKRVRAHVGVGGYGVNNTKKKCQTCGEWYYISNDHWHACPYCK